VIDVRSTNAQIAGSLSAHTLSGIVGPPFDKIGHGTLTAGDANISSVELVDDYPDYFSVARVTFTGTTLHFGTLALGHATMFLTPNASAVSVTGASVHLEPHLYTQCAGQTAPVPAGNGCPRFSGCPDPNPHMVCGWGETTPAADCVMGGAPKSLSTDPHWLHAYSALNAWCFKDSSGSALFSSVTCPGGSESQCLKYCIKGNAVCTAQCRALC
jgi:hypothetical protein